MSDKHRRVLYTIDGKAGGKAAGPSLRDILKEIELFTEHLGGLRLRQYQVEVARSIVRSALKQQGLSFVVCFPRQSGKNELQAQIEVYLLTILQDKDAEIIKVSPTWKPQSLNAMRRLERVASRNLLARNLWKKESGYIYRFGNARIFFLSGSPETNIVGATASTLLEVDEAQDIRIDKYDKEIAPMAASTNATRVFWGTAWTSTTLLARELRASRQAQSRDGIRRVYVLDAERVAQEVPAYGQFVKEQVAKLGRNHPMVRTQFFSEEIDMAGGLFNEGRLALMQGTHAKLDSPGEGATERLPIAFLLDVGGSSLECLGSGAAAGYGGAAEYSGGGEVADMPAGHDSTVLTVVRVNTTTCEDELISAPTYEVLNRFSWVNENQVRLYAKIKALAGNWRPRHFIIDATGLGAGLAAFLDKAFPGRVTPFVFTQASKSRLGWDFLTIIDTGRFRDYTPPDKEFYRQLAATQYEVLTGPAKILKWSVPDGTRDSESGELIHDDRVMSAALCAVLDELGTGISAPTLVINRADPLRELSRGF